MERKKASPAHRRFIPAISRIGPTNRVHQAGIRQILYGAGAQAKLTVSRPGDSAEREADQVADRVMRMPDPLLQRQAEEEPEEEVQTDTVQRQAEESDESEEDEEGENIQAQTLQRQADENETEETESDSAVQAKSANRHGNAVTSSVATRIRSLQGGGQPLPDTTRSYFEPRFGYDFGAVRIHTDTHANQTARSISARAYTLGNDITFGSGHYNPESAGGRRLLAHEMTHVVQQGKAVRRKGSGIPITQRPATKVHRGLWSSFKKRVSGAASWVAGKAKAVGKGIAKVAKGAWNWVKKKVGGLLKKVPGYSVVKAIASGKIFKGGFIKALFALVGKSKLYQRLVSAGDALSALGRWIVKRYQKLGITWTLVKSLFSRSWAAAKRLGIFQLGKILSAIIVIFTPTVRAVWEFGKQVVGRVARVLFISFLKIIGAPVEKVMAFLSRGWSTLKRIIRSPGKFLGYLINAVKRGFGQFSTNIVKHLKAGLFSWLFGTMAKAGINLPAKFDLKGIISLILQILNLTWTAIRTKVVKHIGEPAMQKLEATFDFVKTLVTQGPMALWEQLKEKAGEIKEQVIGAVRSWVITRIVIAAVEKLATMWNPIGALYQIVKTIYNVVMFFIERAGQIAAVFRSIVRSIGLIAIGKIGPAAKAIEMALARTIPVILGFLARLLNLGGISTQVKSVILKVRKPIDRVVDNVVGYIVKKARSLLGRGKAAVKRGVATVAGILFPKKQFSVGGASHTIDAVQGAGTADIRIRSENFNVTSFIQYAKEKGTKTAALSKDLSSLSAKHKKWRKIKANSAANKTLKTSQYAELVNMIEKIWVTHLGDQGMPESKIKWKTQKTPDGERAEKVEVNPLTKRSKIVGGPPQESILGWASESPGHRSRIGRIRAHLLHHNLHGPGKAYNLTPTSSSINQLMYNRVEKPALEAVHKHGRHINYMTVVSYDNTRPEHTKHFAERVEMTAVDVTPKPQGGGTDSKRIEDKNLNEKNE